MSRDTSPSYKDILTARHARACLPLAVTSSGAKIKTRIGSITLGLQATAQIAIELRLRQLHIVQPHSHKDVVLVPQIGMMETSRDKSSRKPSKDRRIG